jgi:hypothetical protein
LRQQAHVPAKACPGLDPGWTRFAVKDLRRQAHVPAKWTRFAVKDMCQQTHVPAKACPGLDPGWTRFAVKDMRQQMNPAHIPSGMRSPALPHRQPLRTFTAL